MDVVTEWATNIVSFSLLMALVLQLPIGKDYLRYIRVFGGFVLILLTVSPLMDFLYSDEKWDFILDLQNLRQGRYDYSEEIILGDSAREYALQAEYEAAIEEKVQELALEKGYETKRCEAEIEGDKEQEEYGTIKRIVLQAERGEIAIEGIQSGENGAEHEKKNRNKMEPIRIERNRMLDNQDRLQRFDRVSSVEEILLAEYLAEYFGIRTDRVTVRISQIGR